MIKCRTDKDFSGTVKSVYKLLRHKYGYTIRISNYWTLLSDSLGIEKFELLDFKALMNGEFETYLINNQIRWSKGEPVDLGDIVKKTLEIGDFTRTEKEYFESGEVEDRIWAIYLAICNPELESEIV